MGRPCTSHSTHHHPRSATPVLIARSSKVSSGFFARERNGLPCQTPPKTTFHDRFQEWVLMMNPALEPGLYSKLSKLWGQPN